MLDPNLLFESLVRLKCWALPPGPCSDKGGGGLHNLAVAQRILSQTRAATPLMPYPPPH